MKRKMYRNVIFLLLGSLLLPGVLLAQPNPEKEAAIKESETLLSEGQSKLQNDNFNLGEADYRKAIALHPEAATGKYNLGNAYYNKSKNAEAMRRFQQAAQTAETKTQKHRAFHNLGNTFMNAKKYQEAVESYKNALRNDPTDDETRYNLALAKELLEKNPPEGGGGGDDNEQDEQDENDQNEENKDQGDQNKDSEGDEGDEEENQDQGEEKDPNKEGDQENENGQPDQPKDQPEKDGDTPKNQQPVPGKLSPQQIQNLLEAMNNEEKKVQDKINAKKQKGQRVRSQKDW
ncbi:tetratricopeptide repeat protein [Altibacter sp. HG106]|uniref:tetratricopeptide repeat protein n=1 Tax=Altibacter sp. HG106 TaxID=3023937 RepID=UPI002350AA13|nr:tetratricopeptide repeat protein [Altibacter sp. HG106]MDC7994873.1 tetratricopeptide repeat protein [Altibacter sp. HG106]